MFVYYISMTSLLWLAVGPQPLSGGLLIVYPFDYTTVAVSGKVERL